MDLMRRGVLVACSWTSPVTYCVDVRFRSWSRNGTPAELGNLLVVKGEEAGTLWFDGRADYSGIFPETIGSRRRITFADWYMHWVDGLLADIDAPFPAAC
jgi:hypothetical protein